MIQFCGTKINLGLKIVRKRTDGFHDIETVFYPLSYGDVLEAVVSDKISFQFSGIHIVDTPLEDNLIWKAYQEMKHHYDIPPISVHLHKVVPPGTGLGGGSADAAAMIMLINHLANLNLSEEQMIDHAKKLGADCAFFILNRPCLAVGKGDDFQSIDINLSDYQFCVVLPDVAVNTVKVYKHCQPNNKEIPLKPIIEKEVSKWKNMLTNDFEKVSIIPKKVLEIKDMLYEKGAIYASMSGSGAAVFGIFSKESTQFQLDNYQTVWC